MRMFIPLSVLAFGCPLAHPLVLLVKESTKPPEWFGGLLPLCSIGPYSMINRWV